MMRNKLSLKFRFSGILGILLILLSGILLAFSSGSFIINFQEVGFTFFSTLQKGVNSVTTSIVNVVTDINDLKNLHNEYNELTSKLKNYEYMQRTNTEIKKENERLKEQLGFIEKVQQKNIPAQIIGRDPNSLFSSITINKGAKDGIYKNMPVIATQNGNIGVVGKVVTVGYGTSIIMPVYDINCYISARIQNSRDIGLISGRGGEDNPLSMKYIKKRVINDLQYGDEVVTSGENDNYMRDIPIGTISKITVLDYDSSLDIEITPIIDFARLETVLVVDQSENK